MSNLCRKGLLMITIMILLQLNLHTPEICRKICCIYDTYMRRIFRQILHIFWHIWPQKVPRILRKFSAIN